MNLPKRNFKAILFLRILNQRKLQKKAEAEAARKKERFTEDYNTARLQREGRNRKK